MYVFMYRYVYVNMYIYIHIDGAFFEIIYAVGDRRGHVHIIRDAEFSGRIFVDRAGSSNRLRERERGWRNTTRISLIVRRKAVMGRGKGKGGRGGGRGGGRKMFIDNIEELQLRNSAIAESRKARAERRGESDSGSGSESESNKEVDMEDSTAAREAALAKMAESRAAAATGSAAVDSVAEGEEQETVFKMSKMGITKNPNEKSSRTQFSVKTLSGAEVMFASDLFSPTRVSNSLVFR